MHVAYIAARLPSLSETFVYRELLAVRALGIDVTPVSVFAPDSNTPDDALRRLADEGLVVYTGSGWRAAVLEALRSPIRAAGTLLASLRDAITTSDAPIRTRVKIPGQALAALGLAARLRAHAVDHLHAHMANTPATIAMYTARHLGIGFSFTGHANDLFVHRSLLPQKIARADFVACISRWHRAFYQRWGAIDDARSPVIRCGVDPPPSTDSANTPRPGAPLRVLCVARLVPKKGIDTLIRAVAALGADTPVECTVIGDGPQRDRLATLIDSLGVTGRVRLLGARPHPEVLDLVRACDTFVLACRRDPGTGDQDGIPVSLMEAMAASRCVVTTNLPPLDELVVADRTGLCVAPDDPGALAAALHTLAHDPALRTRLAHAGRAHVLAEFDRTVNARRLAERFLAAATRRARTPTTVPTIA